MQRFEDRTIIVTGVGSGIGAATAKRFLEEGASVVLNGRRRNKLEEIASGFDTARLLILDGDVSDEKYLQTMVDATVTKFGGIDVLVNNAGISIFGPVLGSSVEDWHKVMRVNVDGVF